MCVGASIAFAAPASAAVRYAEPNGDGPVASCPKSNPCEVHDAAEDSGVNDGDEVSLLPGTYELGSDNIELSDQINLHGALGGPRPVITSTNAGGTTLDGGAAQRIHDLVLRSLDDNPIYGALGTGGPSPTVVERVVAIGENAPGCRTPPELPGIVRDSVCATEGGLAAVTASETGGAHTFALRNVTALGHSAGSNGIRFEVANGALTVLARNVIARGGGTSADVFGGTSSGGALGINLAYSNYLSTEALGVGVGITDPATANNQTDPPQLADPEDGDFQQLPGSPTINAGGEPPDVDLKVKVSCPEEECYVTAKGRAEAGGERFKLKKSKARFLEAGDKAKLKLKAKGLDELKSLLAEDDGMAKIKVKGTDAGGVKAKKKLKVKLTG
jgi:hypothetical protein